MRFPFKANRRWLRELTRVYVLCFAKMLWLRW